MKLAWDSQRRRAKDDGKYVRSRSADLYHSARWTRLSRAWRADHPLCEQCRKAGRFVAAAVVDHIIPYPVCGDFFDTGNLQSLCEDCNRAKGNRDKKLIQEWRINNQNNQSN